MTKTSLLLACVLSAGCGAIEESPGAPSAPGTPSSPSDPATPTTPTEPTREGAVSVHTTESYDGASPTFDIGAGASFGPKEASTPLAEGCALVEDVFAKTTSASTSDSAGTIDLEVFLGGESSTLKLEFDAAKKTYDYLGLQAKGVASGSIRIRARGGAVPAFEASIPTLPPAHVASPAVGAAIGARDLPVSWTCDGPDRPSIVYLSSLTSDVRCYVSKGRELVIPSELVSKVLATEGDLRLFVLGVATTRVDAGDYRVSLSHNTSTLVGLTRE